MNYLYYPGCSLKSSGRGYEESLLPVFEALDVPLVELEDWNCCGATAYMSVDEHAASTLAMRNLALAERLASDSETVDLVTPCAGCYLVLNKAQRVMTEDLSTGEMILKRLRSVGLDYQGRVRVRHPLDVLTRDIGFARIRALVKRPLNGLKVACYYGCQLVRPYADFDDQDQPTSMDRLMLALGAEPVAWPLKTRCCGGTLTGTIRDVGLRLSYLLLREAQNRGADVVATACPLCQFNLECQPDHSPRDDDQPIRLPSAYFTQIMGLAFGLDKKDLALNRLLVPLEPALEALRGV